MKAHPLPSLTHRNCTLAVQQLLVFVDRISVHPYTYSVLAGDLDPEDFSLIATKRSGGPGQSVRASVASAKHQLDEAARLVCKRYAWRGYGTEAGDAAQGAEHRSGFTLIAEAGGATVGTMTVGLDGPGGLAADEIYGEQVSAARSQARRVCELTRLALAEQADTKTVLSTLFAVAYGVASTLHDVTDVFIEVNPRHVGFYRRVFGFVVAASERFCERVQAPAVLLRASIEGIEERLQAYFAERGVDLAVAA